MAVRSTLEVCHFGDTPSQAGRVLVPYVHDEALYFRRGLVPDTETNYVAKEEWNATVDPYPELGAIARSRLGGHVLYEEDATNTVGSNKSLACKTGFSFHYAAKTAAQNVGHPTCAGLDSGRSNKDYHAGLDMFISDAVLLAPYSGEVTFSGWVDGYGNRIEILLDGVQLIVCFNHLKSKLVLAGDRVKAGQKIGFQGNTGCSKYGCGVHLHLELVDTKPITTVPRGTTIIGLYGTVRKMHAAGVLCNPWYAFDFNVNHRNK